MSKMLKPMENLNDARVCGHNPTGSNPECKMCFALTPKSANDDKAKMSAFADKGWRIVHEWVNRHSLSAQLSQRVRSDLIECIKSGFKEMLAEAALRAETPAPRFAKYEDWIASLPKCLPWDQCDGDLPDEPHAPNCPMFGKEAATFRDAFEAGRAAGEPEQAK